jgi:hypothetical protein
MSDFSVGDVIFAHAKKDFIGRAIQLAERLRWNGGSLWNHAAIITDVDKVAGKIQIVQAESRGVTCKWFNSPGDIAPNGHVLVIRRRQPDYLKSVEFAKSQVSDPYGYLTILSIAVSIVAPWFLTVRKPGTWICSALVAESLRAGGWLHDWQDIYMVSPAQLYDAVSSR